MIVPRILVKPEWERFVGPGGRFAVGEPSIGWWPLRRYPDSGELVRSAVIRCPKGHGAALGKLHVVSELGAVSPSFVCPVEGCGFHSCVHLADWPAPGAPFP